MGETFELDPENAIVREVFARFGRAVYASNCLERGMAAAIVQVEWRAHLKPPMTRLQYEDEHDALYATLEALPMGRLFDRVQKLTGLPDELATAIKECLDARNILAHHYFWSRSGDFMLDEGRVRMLEECDNYCALFERTGAMLMEYLRPWHKRHGITEEILHVAGEEVIQEATSRIYGSVESRQSQIGEIEDAWLDIAYDIARSDDRSCACRPSTSGDVRWPGYLGSRYAGVLFVGARHNRKRLWTPALRKYENKLRAWASKSRSDAGDTAFLTSMREAHAKTIPVWASSGVWAIFRTILERCGLESWEQIAFVNLAKCHDPDNDGSDDVYIPGCQRAWPLNDLVAALKPKIVFMAKGGAVGAAVQIAGEDNEDPLVVRYSTHSGGWRNKKHFGIWTAEESPTWRSRLEGKSSI